MIERSSASRGYPPVGERLTQVAIRILDAVGAGLLLLALSPLMIFIAAAVRVDSEGPALFRQERLGLHGTPFTILKFRTMFWTDMPGDWTRIRDPRMTRVGRWLRAFHVDELPQLVNIVAGQMSFVGPRPYRREMIERIARLAPDFHDRLSVKPGLTGVGQLNRTHRDGLEEHLTLWAGERDEWQRPLTVGRYLRILWLTAVYMCRNPSRVTF